MSSGGISGLFQDLFRAVRPTGYVRHYSVRTRDQYVTLKLARFLNVRLRPDTARWIGQWLIVAAERADRGDKAFVSSRHRSIGGGSMVEVPARAFNRRTR